MLPIKPDFDHYPNSQLSPNHAQFPPSGNVQTSQYVSTNLFQQTHTNPQKVVKCIAWLVKEDVALMSSWIFVTEAKARANNQKATGLWSRVAELFEQARAKNPEEIHQRNVESMKGRFKRLNDNVNKWIAAYKEAYGRKRSGMAIKDIETEAHTIYEAGGSKFIDLHVFEEVMSKHPRWELNLNLNATRTHSELKEGDEESHGSSKRLRTNEDGEHSTPSNPETPISDTPTISRPTSRDAAKRKGKGKASQSSHILDEFTTEIRALRITRNNELELMKKLGSDRIELEYRKEERKARKMNVMMLNTLLAKDHLPPEDEKLKHRLIETVFGN